MSVLFTVGYRICFIIMQLDCMVSYFINKSANMFQRNRSQHGSLDNDW